MSVISMCVPSFVRCIKPNADQAPGRFNVNLVSQQLKYLGILETVRIRQLGFSVRLYFEEFRKR